MMDLSSPSRGQLGQEEQLSPDETSVSDDLYQPYRSVQPCLLMSSSSPSSSLSYFSSKLQ